MIPDPIPSRPSRISPSGENVKTPLKVEYLSVILPRSWMPVGVTFHKTISLDLPIGLFSFIDIHFIKLTVSKGFDAYSFILSAIRVMP